MNPVLAAAFVLGLAGSAHCIGMCGPIALAVPSSSPRWGARLLSTLILNSGRLFTYALLGLAFGAFGTGSRLAGLQQGVSIAAGVVLLLSVAVPGVLERWLPHGRVSLVIGRLRSVLGRNLRRTAPEALFLSGVLNGLLPCGLVYAAAIGSTVTGSLLSGVAFMVLFGLGTWPALVAVRMGGGLLGTDFRQFLRRTSPYLVSAVAVLMILRGLELGIPFVSPGEITRPLQATNCH
ncbi:MAG: sulfite exporter TauE/SafE family protein [Flavobacteriales bacterium]|nr:sulfite exporter TauE/SafE family protein [Flavobacteriales bacterium]